MPQATAPSHTILGNVSLTDIELQAVATSSILNVISAGDSTRVQADQLYIDAGPHLTRLVLHGLTTVNGDATIREYYDLAELALPDLTTVGAFLFVESFGSTPWRRSRRWTP